MSTFIAAYSIVLIVVIAYVARMGYRQQQLSRSLEQLQTRAGSQSALASNAPIEQASPIASPSYRRSA